VDVVKNEKIEMRMVEIEGIKKNVLFDTGAAESFIGLGEVKMLARVEKNLLKEKLFSWLMNQNL
jgi:hypothetical protein